VKKIIDVNYWWPTMNRDVHEICHTCDLCQRTSNMLAQNMAKLITTLLEKPFQKWGLDFIGPIKLASHYSRLESVTFHFNLFMDYTHYYHKILITIQAKPII